MFNQDLYQRKLKDNKKTEARVMNRKLREGGKGDRGRMFCKRIVSFVSQAVRRGDLSRKNPLGVGTHISISIAGC